MGESASVIIIRSFESEPLVVALVVGDVVVRRNVILRSALNISMDAIFAWRMNVSPHPLARNECPMRRSRKPL